MDGKECPCKENKGLEVGQQALQGPPFCVTLWGWLSWSMIWAGNSSPLPSTATVWSWDLRYS